MDLKFFKKLRIGGTMDTAALLSFAVGVFASHPLVKKMTTFNLSGISEAIAKLHLSGGAIPSEIMLSPDVIASLGSIPPALGGAHLVNRLYEANGVQKFFKTDLKIKSAALPVLKPGEKGMLAGYLVDTGEPLLIPRNDLVRHLSIVGQSGVGKTVFGQLLMFQQIGAGGGLVFTDGKLDSKALDELYRMAAYHGRENDVLVINPGDPKYSNTYNPILYGDPDEVADRIVSLIPSTEGNAGADHYKQAAKQGCTVLVAAIQKTRLAYTFIDLVILLSSANDLMALEKMLPPCNEKTNLSIFLEQYKIPDKSGEKTIDIKRLKETFGGIGGRLFTFGTGSFGEIMNCTSPEVNLYEAMRDNKIIYVMLPTMGKSQTASNLGKMFLGDARTAFSWIQRLPESEKPNPPLLFFMDELGSYATDALARPFEQNRSANIILCPAYQTMANLESVSLEFSQMVIGNTWVKAYFKVGTHDTAEKAADTIGEESKIQDSLSIVGGESSSGKTAGSAGEGSAGKNENIGFGEREVEGYKVSPADLKSLGLGEAIITIGGSKVYHVHIPMITYTKEFIAEYPHAQINHFRPKFAKGIDLFRSTQRHQEKNKNEKDVKND